MFLRGIFTEPPEPRCTPLPCKEQRKKIEIMQGDAYPLSILLYDQERQAEITPDITEDVEFSVGGIIKSVASGQVYYNENRWIFPLTQSDTFSWRVGSQQIKGRIKFLDGEVKGVDIGEIIVTKSESKKVL